LDPAQYNWNYYQQYASPAHPFNRTALIEAANGSNFYTARGANGHLLLDYKHTFEIDTIHGGFCFHEHDGRGAGGVKRGNPFTNFWYFAVNSLRSFCFLNFPGNF
jgi:hypothetical protein